MPRSSARTEKNNACHPAKKGSQNQCFPQINTIKFVARFIHFSYSSHILVNHDAKNLIHHYLGHPEYVIPLTGWGKLIGSIAIFIPGLKTVKEWAYAGLF